MGVSSGRFSGISLSHRPQRFALTLHRIYRHLLYIWMYIWLWLAICPSLDTRLHRNEPLGATIFFVVVIRLHIIYFFLFHILKINLWANKRQNDQQKRPARANRTSVREPIIIALHLLSSFICSSCIRTLVYVPGGGGEITVWPDQSVALAHNF